MGIGNFNLFDYVEKETLVKLIVRNIVKGFKEELHKLGKTNPNLRNKPN